MQADEDVMALERAFEQELDEGGDLSVGLSDTGSQSDTGAGDGSGADSQSAAQGAEASGDGQGAAGDGGQAGQQGNQQGNQQGGQSGEGGQEGAEGSGEGETPDGVLARDGKNVIPYRVLEETRRKATESDQARQQLEEQLRTERRQREELERKRQELEQHAQQQGEQVSQEGDPLEGLNEEDYPPELVKAIRGLNSQLQQSNQQLAEMQQEQERRQQEAQQANQTAIQQAIDSNPDLATWQSEGGDAWQAAVAHDQRLLNDPRWKNASMEERHKKVVQLTKTELDLPDTESAGNQNKPGEGQQQQQQQQEGGQQQQAASQQQQQPGDQGGSGEASLDDAPAGMSDIAGGTPPNQSEQQDVENMSPSALGERMSQMSDSAIDEMLSRHG